MIESFVYQSNKFAKNLLLNKDELINKKLIKNNNNNNINNNIKELKESLNKLSIDNIAAINLYTRDWGLNYNSLYKILNNVLREEKRDKIKPYFELLKLILDGLLLLPKYNKPIWRGVKLELFQQYPKNENITWWSFSSCTKSMEILEPETFLGCKNKRTLFHILPPHNGIDITLFSNYSNEDEILLLPGSCFIVNSILRQGDLTIIELILDKDAPFMIDIDIPNPNPISISIPTTLSSSISIPPHLPPSSSQPPPPPPPPSPPPPSIPLSPPLFDNCIKSQTSSGFLFIFFKLTI